MGWIVLAIFVFTSVGIVFYGIGMYNGLIRLKHAIDRSWAYIDMLLKQRHDELPKLVETVKGYMAHEKEVLTRVTEARAAVQSAGSMDEKSRADGELRGALSRLFAVAEN
jgi:LemA protein